TEQGFIERECLLEVRASVREMVDPQRLPSSRFERHRGREFPVRWLAMTVGLRAVRHLNVEAIRILDVEALEIARVFGDGTQAALLQFRFDLPRVPRFDAEREIAD